MVGNRFADKYFTRMLLMKILISFQILSRRDENFVRRKRGDGETIVLKVFFHYQASSAGGYRYQNVKRWSKKVKMILRIGVGGRFEQ